MDSRELAMPKLKSIFLMFFAALAFGASDRAWARLGAASAEPNPADCANETSTAEECAICCSTTLACVLCTPIDPTRPTSCPPDSLAEEQCSSCNEACR